MPKSEFLRVRVDPATMGYIRELAARDGVTVSKWVRQICMREVCRPRVYTTPWVITTSGTSGLIPHNDEEAP